MAVQSGFYGRPTGILRPSNRDSMAVQSGFQSRAGAGWPPRHAIASPRIFVHDRGAMLRYAESQLTSTARSSSRPRSSKRSRPGRRAPAARAPARPCPGSALATGSRVAVRPTATRPRPTSGSAPPGPRSSVVMSSCPGWPPAGSTSSSWRRRAAGADAARAARSTVTPRSATRRATKVEIQVDHGLTCVECDHPGLDRTIPAEGSNEGILRRWLMGSLPRCRYPER
jgi:hypothetical protein